MLIAHRIALDPNNIQATYLARAAGTARFAYNWALAEWGRQYQAHKADPGVPAPSEGALRRQLNAIKRTAFPWMLEVTKNAPQMAIRQLGVAFANFFAGRARYPVFRRKGVRDRFTLTNDQFALDGARIRIPLLGWVRLREALRLTGKVLSATVSRTASRWFVSITVDTPDSSHPRPAENQGAVGVDLGLTAQATLSTGEVVTGPKALKMLMGRLQRLSRALSRKQPGSANRHKAKAALARLHARVTNVRRDAQHQFTSSLTRRFHTIGIEDLNVKGMLQNRCLARAIADMGWAEIKRQLVYKAAMRGGIVHVADRWYPSSKLCSGCGEKCTELPLSVRAWTCAGCGRTHDRDLNAAINLKNLAVSSTVSVCGKAGAGRGDVPAAKPALVKQKVSFESV
jgi:putative transposase